MKKTILLLSLLLTACSTNRSLPDNTQILAQHPAPLKIFGIGRYSSNSMILTLIDAQNKYFIIEVPINENLKLGSLYQ